MPASDNAPAPAALKDWFDAARYRKIAKDLAQLAPDFRTKHFLELTLDGLENRSLLQRVRRTTEAIHASLPRDFESALPVLREVAPRFQHNFVAIVLPDFVALYGQEHFTASMDALAYFTRFGSSEFAVRAFLQRDLPRTLAVMERWSRDENEHVRRLSSEGSRPRLPWSFRLEALIADPSPVAPILENLRADPSLYVRKSVANHLNDISKDHPAWTLATLRRWDLTHPHTAWIAKRATRTLIKAGHAETFRLFGISAKPAVRATPLRVEAAQLRLGGTLEFSSTLTSTAPRAQRLVVDYAIHYVKKSGGTSAKVFKLAELTLAPGTRAVVAKRQRIRDFTTRRHYPGKHRIDLLVNGQPLTSGSFLLKS
jgi:3-methyladenine DNA glycosylase AlkC